MIKVFGHTSPDTDTTCSAIVWAWYLSEQQTEATPYILGTLNSETTFVLSHFDVPTPEILTAISDTDSVVIVDTNNPQELPPNISDANILQIIDHHKLVGDLTTDAPADITIRPVACTATIIYDLMGIPADTLPKHISGLMLAAIISDTLEFRSPTTTDHDREVAHTLAKALAIDIPSFANQLFAAKSDISNFSDAELITLDSKKYNVGTSNVRVSVLETTNPQTVLDRQEGIVSAIQTLVQAETDVDEVLFFVIDILNAEAIVLTYNDVTKAIIAQSFTVTATGETVILPGILSRKKQILPVLKYQKAG